MAFMIKFNSSVYPTKSISLASFPTCNPAAQPTSWVPHAVFSPVISNYILQFPKFVPPGAHMCWALLGMPFFFFIWLTSLSLSVLSSSITSSGKLSVLLETCLCSHVTLNPLLSEHSPCAITILNLLICFHYWTVYISFQLWMFWIKE